jgi:UDP-galactose transporter B1
LKKLIYGTEQQYLLANNMCTTTPASTAPPASSSSLKEEQKQQRGHEDDSSSSDMWRLIMCATGICVCFLFYGVLQERLFTTGERRLGPTFALVTACVTNVIVARIWQKIASSKEQEQHQLPHGLLVLTAGCYVGAMAASNEAIPLVSYPVAVLAKSCKLIPTMLVGQLLEGKLHSSMEWIAALCISCGIVLFHMSRLQHQDQQDSSSSSHGMMLLLLSLGMDGILASCQNFLKQSKRPPSAIETMLYINLYALLFLIPLSMISGQWQNGCSSLQHPKLAWNVLILNLTVGVGQIFVFLSIHWYSPFVTTTITTTRKFFTILLSVWSFGHKFTTVQWSGVVMVFVGLHAAIAVQQGQPSQKLKAA